MDRAVPTVEERGFIFIYLFFFAKHVSPRAVCAVCSAKEEFQRNLPTGVLFTAAVDSMNIQSEASRGGEEQAPVFYRPSTTTALAVWP